MSLRRHACKIPSSLKASDPWIWLSDDLLNNAINRFTQGCIPRRNVSLAPGPLEARKRAAKRRMMNLARADGGVPTIDPSLSLISEVLPWKNNWQWQSPTSSIVSNETEVIRLPSWLTRLDIPEIPIQLGTRKTTSRESSHAEIEFTNPEFLASLRNCKDLDGLHQWADQHRIDLREYSRIAFRQLYTSGSSLKDLLEALEDNALHGPGNRNFLLSRRFLGCLDIEDTKFLGSWIERQLYLGIIPPKDMANLAQLLEATAEPLINKHHKCIVAKAIFMGFQSSTVFGLEDISPATLKILLTVFAESSLAYESRVIGHKIIRRLKKKMPQQTMDIIFSFMEKSIPLRARRSKQAAAVSDIMKTLRHLPREHARSLMVNISKNIAGHLPEIDWQSPINRKQILGLLDVWWSSLADNGFFGLAPDAVERMRIGLVLVNQGTEVTAQFLRHLDDHGKAGFCLRKVLKIQRSIRLSHATTRFEEFCRSQESISPFVHMMQVVQEEASLDKASTKYFFRLLQRLQMSETIVEVITSLREKSIIVNDVAVIDSIVNHVQDMPHMAKRIFDVYQELPLEKVPQLAESMILNTRTDERNAMDYYLDRHPSTSEPSCREPIPTIKLRARLLERMAVAYSHSQELTHRVAFRRVYACYRCHLAEDLGCVSPGMVGALTRAAVVRPLQSGRWVSSVALRWILSLIRSIESPDVANKVDVLIYKWRGEVVRDHQLKAHRERQSRFG